MHVRSYFLSALVSACAIGAYCGESDVRPSSSNTDELAQLVRSLGDDDFEVREEAERKLIEHGESAERAVEAAIKSKDPEVNARAARALIELQWFQGRKNEDGWLAALGPVMGTTRIGATPAAADMGLDTGGVPNRKPAWGENPVDRALNWLEWAQEDDGHWDSKKFGAQNDADIEQTSLALLAMLGAGHTEKVGAHKLSVTKGLAWLRQQQRENGAFCRNGQAIDGIAHALAGMTMSEGAGMARVAETRKSAQMAADYSTTVHQSTVNGEVSGFGREAHSKSPNLFATLFFTMQLKSTKVAGLKVAPESFGGIVDFLKTCDKGGSKGYSFTPGGYPSPRATFMGCLCATFTGVPGYELDAPVLRSVRDFQTTTGHEHSDVLVNYIGTLVVFQTDARSPWIDGSGSLWSHWSTELQTNIVPAMRDDKNAAGSWDPSGAWAGGGRVLATALNALCFEIYYRYSRLR